jgi:hypothetical protein
MDIGVDVIGWTPVRLSAIRQRLATLPPFVDLEVDNGYDSPPGLVKGRSKSF